MHGEKKKLVNSSPGFTRSQQRMPQGSDSSGYGWIGTLPFAKLKKKINNASHLHKITELKEKNQHNMNFTQKYDSMNIY